MIVATLSYKFGFNMWRITMENRESESELNECKKKLNKAHQTIEELKIKMTQDKKNYKWEIRELNKEKDALKAHNTDLFNWESNALIRADDLEKENIALKKEKKKLEIKIEKLEKENENLLKKKDECTRDADWERLGKAGI